MPPSNSATKTPNLLAPRQADRLPSTMAALAAIPEEEIWGQVVRGRDDPVAAGCNLHNFE